MKRFFSFLRDVGGLLQDLAELIPALFRVQGSKPLKDDSESFWDSGEKKEEQHLA